MPAPIAPRLEAHIAIVQKAPGEIKVPLFKTRDELIATFDYSNTPKVGSPLPSFSLPNAVGKNVQLQNLLNKPGVNGLLITFYRGGWCPFCNIALRGLQERLEEFTSAGVILIAISPEVPDQTLSTKEKSDLTFEVLSDESAKYAEELGIAWHLSEAYLSVFDKFGTDLKKVNGNEDAILPLPSNILVDKEGKIRNVYVNPDWSKRLEPETAIEWVRAL